MTDVQPKTNILVVGIYWSGSGAVVDYLRGHPDCFTPWGEFTDIKREARVLSALTAPSSAHAQRRIARMWRETAFGKLPAAWWWSRKAGDQNRLPLKKQLRHNRLKLRALSRARDFIARGGEHFDPAPWKQWIADMGQLYAADKKAVVWNQPLWIGRHETLALQVFDPAKLIVVHRDPEDQFAEVERQGKLGKAKSDPAFSGDRSDPIRFVLEGITRKLESLVELKRGMPDADILTLRFERFVLDHETVSEEVCRFLDIDQPPAEPAFFYPEQSQKNIGIGQSDRIQAMLAPYQNQIQRMSDLRRQLD